MPTVDIISPGGAFTPAAVGDAQTLTANFTITSGTATLTCNSASPFSAADTGRFFSLKGAGAVGPDNTWLGGTMTFISATQVTLSVNASVSLTNQSAKLIWGSDDAPAFRAFNTWAQAQTSPITLTLGTGSKGFLWATSDPNPIISNSPASNVHQPLTVIGNGRTTTKLYGSTVAGITLGAINWLKTGDGAYGGSSIWTARLNPISAGNITLICKTPADTGNFSVNTWALLAGIDLQAGGQPVNPFFFEYVYITAINAGTGAITLLTPIINSYLDTWPNFSAGTLGLGCDQGGPATLYALDPSWDIDVTYQSFGIDNSAAGQTYAPSRSIQVVDLQVFDVYGLIGTGNKFISFTNCNLPYTMEFDKDVQDGIFDSTTTGQLLFQSSNNNVTIRNGCNITGGLNGTPRNLIFTGSTITSIGLGTIGFGRTDSFVTSGSTFTGGLTYSGVVDQGEITNTGIRNDYTMNNGVIRIPKSFAMFTGTGSGTNLTATAVSGTIRLGDFLLGNGVPSGTTIVSGGPGGGGGVYVTSNPTTSSNDALRTGGLPYGCRWMQPGTKCYFVGQFFAPAIATGVDWGPMFTVLSVTGDAQYIYVTTDWPYGGFPTWSGSIHVCPSANINFASDTTTSNVDILSLMAANAAGYHVPGTYRALSLTGGTVGSESAIPNWTPLTGGRLISFTVDVTTPYTGTQPSLFWRVVFGNGSVVGSGNYRVPYNPNFDLRTIGRRVIRPNSVSGTVGADSALALPDPKGWFSNHINGYAASQNITAEYTGNPAVGPVFTAELILDQGQITSPTLVRPRIKF